MKILRSIAAIVLGVIASGAVTFIVHEISHNIYPLPEGTDPNDTEALRKVIPTLPVGSFVMVLVAWESGAFLGSLVSALIAGRARVLHALPIGLFVLAASIAMFFMLPHPNWLVLAGLLLPLPISLLAGKIVAHLFPPAPSTQTNPS